MHLPVYLTNAVVVCSDKSRIDVGLSYFKTVLTHVSVVKENDIVLLRLRRKLTSESTNVIHRWVQSSIATRSLHFIFHTLPVQ
jgi:hypothetical protein